MVRKVFKTGNSLVVSVPREYLEALGIDNGSDVNIELVKDKKQLVITPVPKQPDMGGVDMDFAQQLAKFVEDYRPALDALTEDAAAEDE